MKYMLLIYQDDAPEAPRDTPEWHDLVKEYVALDNDLKANGTMIDSQPLHRPETAATVRVRDGKTMVTDGPFAETSEWLGGYYYIDVPTREDAIAIAARIPGARTNSIEVRQILDLEL